MATSQTPSIMDVLDRVLDKGVVIDAYVRVAIAGIDVLSVDARIVVASIETYFNYSDALAAVTLPPPSRFAPVAPVAAGSD